MEQAVVGHGQRNIDRLGENGLHLIVHAFRGKGGHVFHISAEDAVIGTVTDDGGDGKAQDNDKADQDVGPHQNAVPHGLTLLSVNRPLYEPFPTVPRAVAALRARPQSPKNFKAESGSRERPGSPQTNREKAEIIEKYVESKNMHILAPETAPTTRSARP